MANKVDFEYAFVLGDSRTVGTSSRVSPKEMTEDCLGPMDMLYVARLCLYEVHFHAPCINLMLNQLALSAEHVLARIAFTVKNPVYTSALVCYRRGVVRPAEVPRKFTKDSPKLKFQVTNFRKPTYCSI